MVTWSDNETPSANKFFGRRRGASAIGRIKEKQHVYEKISKTLARNGIHKSSDQCRAKMKTRVMRKKTSLPERS